MADENEFDFWLGEWDLEWDTRALAQKDPRVVHRKTTTVQRERGPV